jgi:hypothetical protein
MAETNTQPTYLGDDVIVRRYGRTSPAGARALLERHRLAVETLTLDGTPHRAIAETVGVPDRAVGNDLRMLYLRQAAEQLPAAARSVSAPSRAAWRPSVRR